MTRTNHRAGIVATVVIAGLAAACGGMQENQSTTPAQTAQTADTTKPKMYQLTGKIVAVKAQENALTIDGNDVPGFMSAMTMDYSVKSADSLAGLNAGDEITADIVVPEGGTAYLQNIKVTKKAE